MKDKSRRILAGILAGILGVQLLGGAVVESHAEAEANVVVTVMDGKDSLTGAEVEADLNKAGGRLILTESIAVPGTYKAGTVSANAVEGSYLVTVAADGYETSTQEVRFTKNERDISGTVDVSNYRLFQVSGSVTDKEGNALSDVTVRVGGKSAVTDTQGAYTLLLTKGTYTLSLQKNGYKTVTETLTVTEEPCSVSTNGMPKAYSLWVPVNNREMGSVSVTSGGRTAEPFNDSYTCYEGEEVVISADPKEGYRLTIDCMLKMEPESLGGELYRYKINDLNDTSANVEYRVDFEEAGYAWIYYDSLVNNDKIEISRISHAVGGIIEKKSDSSFQVKADTAGKYYIKNVTGPVEKTGADNTYTFQKPGAAEVYYQKDTTPPELNVKDSMTVSGNMLASDSGLKWYLNVSKDLYMAVTDEESSVDTVQYSVDGFYYSDMKQLDKYRFQCRINADNINKTTTGSTIRLTARDKVGNTGQETVQVYFDDKPPAVESIKMGEGNQSFIQNGIPYINADAVEIKAKITDNYNVKTVKYYFSQTELSKEETKAAYATGAFQELNIQGVPADQDIYTINLDTSALGTGRYYVYLTAEDMAGNCNTETFAAYEFRMDKSAPDVPSLTDGSKQPKAWKKGSDSISMNAVLTDEETPGGLSFLYKVAKAGSGEPAVTADDPNWTRTGDAALDKISYEIKTPVPNPLFDGAWEVWMYAKDGCGNISRGTSYTFYLDTLKPELSHLTYEVRENGQKTGIADYFFGTFFRKNTVKGSTQTVELTVTAKERDDHLAAYPKEEQPAIQDMKLYYVLKEEDGQADAYVKTLSENSLLPRFTHEETAVAKEGDTYTFRFTVPSNAVFYRILVAGMDKAGNCAVTVPKQNGRKSDLVMVDSQAPKATLTLQKAYEKADYKEKGKNWYRGNRNVTYEIQAEDTASGLFSAKLSINDKTIKEETYTSTASMEMTNTKQYTLKAGSGPIGADGRYTFAATVLDNAGNITEKKETIYIDKDKPKITEITFAGGAKDELKVIPMQYGYFFKEKTKVIVRTTDYIGTSSLQGSGVSHVTYYLTDEKGKKTAETTLAAKEGKKGEYESSFTIPQGFKGQIYIKTADHTGQECAYRSPKGTVIESLGEHKTHAYTKIVLPQTPYQDEEGNPLFASKPVLTFQTGDSKSGIARNEWQVKAFHDSAKEGEGILTVATVYEEKTDRFRSALSGDTDWKLPAGYDLNLVTKADKTYPVQNERNHIEAMLKLTDNVGNSDKPVTTLFSVDSEKPIIEIEYDNHDVKNEKYYKKPRTASITVTERNFSQEDCTFTITGDGAKIGEWSHQGGGGCNGTVHTDACRYECHVLFDEDEDYTFTFSCTDRAGNEGSYGQTDEFTIDQTNPIIHVSYDNDNVRNGSYYKEARHASVVIEDRNFHEEETIVTTTAAYDGKAIEGPKTSAFTKTEAEASAAIAYEADGDYTFDIKTTDLAGNEAEVFVPHAFTIDTTAPELVMEGVEDGSANQGVAAPKITYQDVNLDEEMTEISLQGANHGKVKYEAAKKNVPHGKEISLGDFKYKKAVDDLYTLEAVVEDLAGNQTSEARTFSVNRFGSVYLLEKNTQALVDDFYSQKEKDVIITEINVDTLEFEEIVYSHDGDIVPLKKGSDYEVKSKKTKEKWKQYDYHIKAENFKREGAYVVTIYSEDKAKNKSSNKAKGKSVEFVIDKTPPSIVVAGIKEGGQYREVSREVTLDVADNVLLDSVEVYVDGGIKARGDREELLDSNGILKTRLEGANRRQVLLATAKDAAGNTVQSKELHFLITKNLFIQWYSSRPLFYGSLFVLAAGGITAAVFLQKRKGKKQLKMSDRQ